MDNTKIIAEALLDLSKSSKSEIIELAKDDELIKVAEKIGIVIPSPDLGIIKTIYAQVDVANRNGVRLPKEAVIKALPTLRLKQANWSHMGKNYVCGLILDGKLEGNDIIIYTAVYKSLFVEEWDKAKELFANNDLSVSFEIWSVDPSTMESVVKFNDDGTRTIDPICFHGVGILIGDGEKPACPKAYVKKLLAIFNIDKYEKITDKKFEENLVTASMAIEEPKCKNCQVCECEKEILISKILSYFK